MIEKFFQKNGEYGKADVVTTPGLAFEFCGHEKLSNYNVPNLRFFHVDLIKDILESFASDENEDEVLQDSQIMQMNKKK